MSLLPKIVYLNKTDKGINKRKCWFLTFSKSCQYQHLVVTFLKCALTIFAAAMSMYMSPGDWQMSTIPIVVGKFLDLRCNLFGIPVKSKLCFSLAKDPPLHDLLWQISQVFHVLWDPAFRNFQWCSVSHHPTIALLSYIPSPAAQLMTFLPIACTASYTLSGRGWHTESLCLLKLNSRLQPVGVSCDSSSFFPIWEMCFRTDGQLLPQDQ